SLCKHAISKKPCRCAIMNDRVFHPVQIAAHLVELVADVLPCDAVELAQGCIGFREQCIETAVGEIGVSMAKLEAAPFRLAHPAPPGRVARVLEDVAPLQALAGPADG